MTTFIGPEPPGVPSRSRNDRSAPDLTAVRDRIPRPRGTRNQVSGRVDRPAFRPRAGQPRPRVLSRRAAIGGRDGSAEVVRRATLAEWGWLTSVAIFTFLIVLLVGLVGGSGAPLSNDIAILDIRSGDTLGKIAARAAPESDPHAVIERIMELNGPVADPLEPGRELLVPVGD